MFGSPCCANWISHRQYSDPSIGAFDKSSQLCCIPFPTWIAAGNVSRLKTYVCLRSITSASALSCNMSAANEEETAPLSDLLLFSAAEPVPVNGSRVRTAVVDAPSRTLVAATEGKELVAGGARIAVPASVRALCVSRFVAVRDAGLPTTSRLVVALLDGQGLALFSLPALERVGEPVAEALAGHSRDCRLFAADELGGQVVGEAFRLAVAAGNKISLLDVNVPQGSVTVLSETSVADPVAALAFAEMTVVASTARDHCMLRIARSGSMALAAKVPRTDPAARAGRGAPVADTGAAVMNFFGGLFTRRNMGGAANSHLAIPLPDNRWILNIDQELVTYSSFGAKLEDMENAFKSKLAIDIPESAISAALSVVGSPPRHSAASAGGSVVSGVGALPRTVSVSSMASMNSAATTFTARTLVDEALAKRAEKPPSATVFVSPFVLSVTEKCQLLAFAANGSVPGVVFSLNLVEEGKPVEHGLQIVRCAVGRSLAMVYWPSGRVLEIKLADDLHALIEEREKTGEYRSALSLVPLDDVERTIVLRRKLAAQAREADWHDAAIDHMQHVVNLCVAREGVGQLDLISEAVELRGPRGSSWESDEITATLWADFLFKLRRRILVASPADVDILETMCKADVSATRIKALFKVKHSISIDAGEAAITDGGCALQELERVEALAALYTSLYEHDKALVLLENSGINRVYQTVCAYLHRSIEVSQDTDVFFKHVRWVAAESAKSKSNEADFLRLLDDIIDDAIAAASPVKERIMQEMMHIVVEQTPQLIPIVVNHLCPEKSLEEPEPGSEVSSSPGEKAKNPSIAEPERQTIEKLKKERPTATPVEPQSVPAGGSALDAKPSELAVENECTSIQAPRVSADLLAVALIAGMAKAHILEDHENFDRLRDILGTRVLHKENPDYHSETLLKALQGQAQSMALHEELAFLLGRQGRHEAAARELAAEPSLSTSEAERRFEKLLPAGDKSSATQALVAAYLRVSSEERADRIAAAAEVVHREGGYVDVEKVLEELNDANSTLTLRKMKPFLQAALAAGNERLRIAELIRALRTSEVRRVREEVLMRRRRCVIIGHDRACSICTRRIGDSVFAAYPDGSVTHLVCHMSSLK